MPGLDMNSPSFDYQAPELLLEQDKQDKANNKEEAEPLLNHFSIKEIPKVK